MTKRNLYITIFLMIGVLSCAGEVAVSGELIVFHAGSLAVPLREAAKAFRAERPRVRIVLESAGSLACARKITELNKPCDVFASADYSIIKDLLIPDFTSWAIPFSGNEMGIAFHEKSRNANEINKENWFDILLDERTSFGRSDPNSDPCGYRAIFVMALAERLYKKPGLAKTLQEKNREYIRPKETDLLSLLEMGEIDYIFIYRSVAIQHGLKFLILPEEINLGSPGKKDLYGAVEARVTGGTPGSLVTKYGAPIVYGITLPESAPNPEAAIAFVDFLLDKERGGKILEKFGQPCETMEETETFSYMPDALKRHVRPVSESASVDNVSVER